MTSNPPNYAVHEVQLTGGKSALRAYVAYDQTLVTAMRNIQKRTERLKFGKDTNGRPFWTIDASSKEAEAFSEAIARAAMRAADHAALSAP